MPFELAPAQPKGRSEVDEWNRKMRELENQQKCVSPDATAQPEDGVMCPHHHPDQICYWVRPNRYEQRTCASEPCRPAQPEDTNECGHERTEKISKDVETCLDCGDTVFYGDIHFGKSPTFPLDVYEKDKPNKGE